MHFLVFTDHSRILHSTVHIHYWNISCKEKYERSIHKFRRIILKVICHQNCMLLRLFRKWWQTGSMSNKKKLCPKRALTRENLDIHARIEINPRNSSRRPSQEVGISQTSGFKILKFHPYKIRLGGQHFQHLLQKKASEIFHFHLNVLLPSIWAKNCLDEFSPHVEITINVCCCFVANGRQASIVQFVEMYHDRRSWMFVNC